MTTFHSQSGWANPNPWFYSGLYLTTILIISYLKALLVKFARSYPA